MQRKLPGTSQRQVAALGTAACWGLGAAQAMRACKRACVCVCECVCVRVREAEGNERVCYALWFRVS